MVHGIVFVILASALHAVAGLPKACATIVVGAKASTTLTPMTTHSNDCADCDFRLVKVPARQFPAGAMRDVPLFAHQYPRYVGSGRGPTYERTALHPGFFNWTNTPVIAQIPQVNRTFGYLDGVYGIINEHQVALGESTCGAKLAAKPRTRGGSAVFDMTDLSRLALERTKTAREAIRLMGAMAEAYGFYGMGWDAPDPRWSAGEALTVTDPTEAWVLHVLPDDTGASAVWVAQRVPDTHVAAVANQFVIHAVNLTDIDNFMGSANMLDVAKRNGFWDGHAPFDFTVAFAMPITWHYVATRRVWRVFTLANPSVALSPTTDTYATTYPFSVETDGPLDALDLMRFQRDHFENTEFDLTQGPAAGPHGNPDRYGINATERHGGHFERSISTSVATYSFVTVLDALHPQNALLWFGPYAPHATTYVPIYVHATAVPAVLSDGLLRRFDLTSSFWVNALLGNHVARWYSVAHPVVEAARRASELKARGAQHTIQATAQGILDTQGQAAAVDYLTGVTDTQANQAHATSVNLVTDILTMFHDGCVVSDLAAQEFHVAVVSYPKWWLESVGYYNTTNRTATNDDDDTDDDFESNEVEPKASSCHAVVSGGIVGAFIFVVVLSLALGFHLGRRTGQTPARGYAFIQ
ncbi:Aste57867_1035 [Aphanomyces stellatus]|uniref:Aste57867_1035 protein n=1 Tax=Aphanomyces stellatus TaxID=120398 RepID=A0A485K4E9_9STRA|nr:hypothetical protein As57867_001034 [Aphanomyces stellatus]VFT78257.1 Aste57867_1035 [Aphanomyces stellatus]